MSLPFFAPKKKFKIKILKNKKIKKPIEKSL
jgi:hypothetical protein